MKKVVGWFDKLTEYGCVVILGTIQRGKGELTLLLNRCTVVSLEIARERPSPTLRAVCLQGAQVFTCTWASSQI